MAIRVRLGETLNFGTFAAATRVTRIRFRRASDDGQPVEVALDAPVQVGVNEQFELPDGDVTILYPSGALGDTHMQAVVESYWGAGGSLEIEIDALTAVNTVVAAAGYAQQTTTDWDVDVVPD